jgi:hypothetical protein
LARGGLPGPAGLSSGSASPLDVRPTGKSPPQLLSLPSALWGGFVQRAVEHQ